MPATFVNRTARVQIFHDLGAAILVQFVDAGGHVGNREGSIALGDGEVAASAAIHVDEDDRIPPGTSFPLHIPPQQNLLHRGGISRYRKGFQTARTTECASGGTNTKSKACSALWVVWKVPGDPILYHCCPKQF
jgi:hypothetical protein